MSKRSHRRHKAVATHGIEDFLLDLREKENPYWNERQGKMSTAAILEHNVLAEESKIRQTLEKSFDFREIQKTGLYSSSGYFNNLGEYREGMPLLPQFLSPLFGTTIGELAFSNYLHMNYRTPVVPAFLGLGAGQGFLDYDLISHVTSDLFFMMSEEFSEHAKSFGRASNFIVTDAGNYSIRLIEKEFRDLFASPALKDRIKIEKMDATDFALPKSPYGIVYANELIDNLPTEPVVHHNGSLYCIKLLAAYNGSGIELGPIEGYLSKEQAHEEINSGKSEKLNFVPVLVPLSSDPFLSERADRIASFRRIDTPDFGGIYPLHLGLDGMFESVKRSFEHGTVVLIDYYSHAEGMHNWNVALNHFKHFTLGKQDIDFQVDPSQVYEIGYKHGFSPMPEFTRLDVLLKQSIRLVERLGPQYFIRWSKVQKNTIPEKNIVKMFLSYQMGISLSSEYALMVFQF